MNGSSEPKWGSVEKIRRTELTERTADGCEQATDDGKSQAKHARAVDVDQVRDYFDRRALLSADKLRIWTRLGPANYRVQVRDRAKMELVVLSAHKWQLNKSNCKMTVSRVSKGCVRRTHKQ